MSCWHTAQANARVQLRASVSVSLSASVSVSLASAPAALCGTVNVLEVQARTHTHTHLTIAMHMTVLSGSTCGLPDGAYVRPLASAGAKAKMSNYALARARARLGVHTVVVLPNAHEGRVYLGDGGAQYAHGFALGDESVPNKQEQEAKCVRISFTAQSVPLLVRRHVADVLFALRARFPVAVQISRRSDFDALLGIEFVPVPLQVLYAELGVSERDGNLLTLV